MLLIEHFQEIKQCTSLALFMILETNLAIRLLGRSLQLNGQVVGLHF